MKLETVDRVAARQTGTGGRVYRIDAQTAYPGGAFYFGRPWINSNRYSYFESFLLPDLGIQACTYTAIAPNTAPWDWYVDIARITEQDGIYQILDLYLDLGVYEGRGYDVLDLDEFADALQAGSICAADTDFALRALHRLTTLLPAHGYSMERLICTKLGLQRLPLRRGAPARAGG